MLTLVTSGISLRVNPLHFLVRSAVVSQLSCKSSYSNTILSLLVRRYLLKESLHACIVALYLYNYNTHQDITVPEVGFIPVAI